MTKTMYKVTVIAVENCLVSSVVGILDIFSVANHLEIAPQGNGLSPIFSTQIASRNGEQIPGMNGIIMNPDCRIEDVVQTDIVFVPAILPPVESVISHSASIINKIKDLSNRDTVFVSACTGSFLLAEAGVLDGKRATTHWRAVEKFRARYPQVDLDAGYTIIDEGNVITAGGYYFYQKLALYLIERFASQDLVAKCAKTLLIDPELQPQAAFMIFSPQKQHGDKQILKVQQWLDLNYNQRVSVDKLASIAGLGARNFKRRFTHATGDTPLLYFQRLRVEAAKKQLETTMDTVEEITRRVGYEDVASFRRLFKRITGLSPNGYRKKFSRRQIISKQIN